MPTHSFRSICLFFTCRWLNGLELAGIRKAVFIFTICLLIDHHIQSMPSVARANEYKYFNFLPKTRDHMRDAVICCLRTHLSHIKMESLVIWLIALSVRTIFSFTLVRSFTRSRRIKREWSRTKKKTRMTNSGYVEYTARIVAFTSKQYVIICKRWRILINLFKSVI